MTDTIVIGAGVVGVTTAHALASLGHDVLLIDRASSPAQGASFANGAQLSYAYTDALAAPGLIPKLPRLALGLDPVFRLGRSVDPDHIAWLLSFLRNMTAARYRRNTLAVLELALESRAAMASILARHPIAFDHARPGKMHLYYDGEGLAAAEATIALKRPLGVEQSILDADAAIAIDPALAQVDGLAGVLHSPGDEVGDARAFTTGLLAAGVAHLPLVTCFDFDVAAIHRDAASVRVTSRDGRTIAARRIVLCAGDAAARLAKPLGLRLPIRPMKGYSFTAPPGPDTPRASLTDTRRKLVFCRLGDRVRVAGLAELGARSAVVDPARAALLRRLAAEALPLGARYDAIEAEWAGLRPLTPSSQPIIRRVDDRIYLNVGHGSLGWTLAAGAAARVAAMISPDPASRI